MEESDAPTRLHRPQTRSLPDPFPWETSSRPPLSPRLSLADDDRKWRQIEVEWEGKKQSSNCSILLLLSVEPNTFKHTLSNLRRSTSETKGRELSLLFSLSSPPPPLSVSLGCLVINKEARCFQNSDDRNQECRIALQAAQSVMKRQEWCCGANGEPTHSLRERGRETECETEREKPRECETERERQRETERNPESVRQRERESKRESETES